MRSTLSKKVRLVLGMGVLIPLLVSCGNGNDSPQETSSESASSSSTAATSTTDESTETSEQSTTSTKAKDLDPSVKEVAEKFKTLAPESLFEKFNTCVPSGVEDAYQCSGGSEVGQFQFFQNSSKAASTTQLLTELRSSRVVEDSGKKIVGWTTMGTMSIITVVDNDKGLVLQQMVSSDKIDPEKRIYELGLASPKESSAESTSSTEPTSNS